MSDGPKPEEVKLKCGACQSLWRGDEVEEFDLNGERLLPGEVVPYGLCPKCGSKCHPEILVLEDGDLVRELQFVLDAYDKMQITLGPEPWNSLLLEFPKSQADRIRRIITAARLRESGYGK